MKAMMRFSPVVGIVLLLLLAALPLAAQFGAVEGTVKDETGKPIPNVLVVIERQDIKGRYEVKTDKKGNFLYMGLPSGPSTRYRVQFFRDGQLIFQSDNVIVQTSEYNRVDVDLGKERQRQLQQMTEEQRRQLEEQKQAQEQFKQMEDQFKQGLAALEQKQYTDAITYLEAAAASDPTQFAIWANLGRAYTGANQVEKAIEAYEKAIATRTEAKPEDVGVYNNLAALYVRKNRVPDAQQAYEKAAALDPPHAAIYYYNFGANLVNQGLMKEAIEPLKKALELDPNRAIAYYWLGVALYANAESKIEGGAVKTLLLPGTVEAFEKYLELEPNGQFANDARSNLDIIAVQVPASMNVRKKKR